MSLKKDEKVPMGNMKEKRREKKKKGKKKKEKRGNMKKEKVACLEDLDYL